MSVNILHLGAIGISSVVLSIADRLHLFQKHDVKVHIVPVTGTQVPDLTSTNPMGHIGAPAALMRAAGGADLRILACFDYAMLSGSLVVSPDIEMPKQLKGRRLGARVTGAALWLHTVLALEKLGLNYVRDNIEIAEIGDPPAIIAELEAGSIDGAVLAKAHCEQLTQKGFKVLLDMAPLRVYGAPDALVAKGDYVQEFPEVSRRVLAAMIEAVACAMSPINDPMILEAIKFTLAIRNDSAAEKALGDFRAAIAIRPYPTVERLGQMQRMMAAPRPAVTAVSIPALIDDSIVRKLDEDGYIDRLLTNYEVPMPT